MITGFVVLVLGIGLTTLFNMYSTDCYSDVGKIFQFFSFDHRTNCSNVEYALVGSLVIMFAGIVILIWGMAAPSGMRMSTPSQYICGYCKYIAESERELHNHSLNCQDYKDEVEKEKHSAIDILNERYAKGEISKEEYDRMKKDLSSGI